MADPSLKGWRIACPNACGRAHIWTVPPDPAMVEAIAIRARGKRCKRCREMMSVEELYELPKQDWLGRWKLS